MIAAIQAARDFTSLWGIIVATLFVAEVPTGLLADRLGRARAVQLALALQVLGELIFLFAGQLNRHIAGHYRATLLSLINMASGIYVALLGLLIGRLADFSLPDAFLLMGAIIIAGGLLFRVD